MLSIEDQLKIYATWETGSDELGYLYMVTFWRKLNIEEALISANKYCVYLKNQLDTHSTLKNIIQEIETKIREQQHPKTVSKDKDLNSFKAYIKSLTQIKYLIADLFSTENNSSTSEKNPLDNLNTLLSFISLLRHIILIEAINSKKIIELNNKHTLKKTLFYIKAKYIEKELAQAINALSQDITHEYFDGNAHTKKTAINNLLNQAKQLETALFIAIEFNTIAQEFSIEKIDTSQYTDLITEANERRSGAIRHLEQLYDESYNKAFASIKTEHSRPPPGALPSTTNDPKERPNEDDKPSITNHSTTVQSNEYTKLDSSEPNQLSDIFSSDTKAIEIVQIERSQRPTLKNRFGITEIWSIQFKSAPDTPMPPHAEGMSIKASPDTNIDIITYNSPSSTHALNQDDLPIIARWYLHAKASLCRTAISETLNEFNTIKTNSQHTHSAANHFHSGVRTAP